MTVAYEGSAVLEKWKNPKGWKAIVAVLCIALFMALVGLLVYETGGTAFVWLHTMYLPIILAAAVYRVPGGFAAALVGGLELGPLMPLQVSHGISQDSANWLLRTLFFILVGTVTGFLFAWIDRQYHSLKLAYDQLALSHQELQKTQLELIQAEKMESIGRLAAGVAHEVKNPLAVLQLGIDYLAIATNGNDAIAEAIEEMDSAVKKADKVVKGLIDYSRFEKLDLKIQPLNPIVEESLNLVRHEIMKERIALETSLAPALPPIALDRGKIQQVFINLLINAVHAMEGGGNLSITTSPRVLTEEYLNGLPAAPGRFKTGDNVVVTEITDSGTGIPEEKISKVFDPFFTTKPVGKGTGLGLSVSRRILELHAGWIGIANRKEGGAQVTLFLKMEERSESA